MSIKESQQLDDLLQEIIDLVHKYKKIDVTNVNTVVDIESLIKTDESFLRLAYWVIVEREIDTSGLTGWLSQLKSGLSKPALIQKLYESPEFQNRMIGESGWAEINQKLHQARLELVQTVLPSAKIVLDIGGYSSYDPKGALLGFGYPYLPDKISIVDLHPNEMMFPGPIWSKQMNSGHCCIEYFYRSMVDLTCFEATSFDLIWSGESIEHVTVEDAESIISQAYKLLKPGGKLALDTPNRLATQLISPGAYTHPEHKIEYDYETLCKLLKKHNFNIIESKGIIDLSQSIKDNKCSNFYNEFMQSSNLNDNPETSYCFYICCVKPDD